MELILDRWFHIMAGIVWIGLLYYFNFVQAVALPKAKADGTAAGITKHNAPQALLWFRWAAVVTWLTGAWYLERSGLGLGTAFMLKGSAAAIGLGAWLGTIMLCNVWVLIWPNQKKVLGIVPADARADQRTIEAIPLAQRRGQFDARPFGHLRQRRDQIVRRHPPSGGGALPDRRDALCAGFLPFGPGERSRHRADQRLQPRRQQPGRGT